MLRDKIQKAEDEYAALLRCKKIRVVEGGGDKLFHILGKNNPWAARQVCSDPTCKTCESRTWIRERAKAARKKGKRLPKIMLSPGSSLCRREGANYCLQCLECLQAGVDTRYQGETSRSGRQRHAEHVSGLENGSVSNPLVLHSVEQHGGLKPRFLSIITRIEPSALYRACREAVLITRQPVGTRNMNRCTEWNCPRVPVLIAKGGDERDPGEGEPGPNPRPEWATRTMTMIAEGRLKIVKFWDGETAEGEGEGSGGGEAPIQQPRHKRQRLHDQQQDQAEDPVVVVAAEGPPDGTAGPDIPATNHAARLTLTAQSAANTAALRAVEPLAAGQEAGDQSQAVTNGDASVGVPTAQPTADRLTRAATPAAASAAAGAAAWPLTAWGRAVGTTTAATADKSAVPTKITSTIPTTTAATTLVDPGACRAGVPGRKNSTTTTDLHEYSHQTQEE